MVKGGTMKTLMKKLMKTVVILSIVAAFAFPTFMSIDSNPFNPVTSLVSDSAAVVQPIIVADEGGGGDRSDPIIQGDIGEEKRILPFKVRLSEVYADEG